MEVVFDHASKVEMFPKIFFPIVYWQFYKIDSSNFFSFLKYSEWVLFIYQFSASSFDQPQVLYPRLEDPLEPTVHDYRLNLGDELWGGHRRPFHDSEDLPDVTSSSIQGVLRRSDDGPDCLWFSAFTGALGAEDWPVMCLSICDKNL